MVRSSGGGKASLPWSVKGVTHTARDIAKDQAGEAGATMGHWLSGVVRRVGAAEASGKALVPTSTPPVSPTASKDVTRSESDRPVAAEPIDESELVAMVSERILATEERLVGLLGNLEDIIVSLGDRLERLESRVETESAPPRELGHDPIADGTDAADEAESHTRLN
jgi:hypothetical protein